MEIRFSIVTGTTEIEKTLITQILQKLRCEYISNKINVISYLQYLIWKRYA